MKCTESYWIIGKQCKVIEGLIWWKYDMYMHEIPNQNLLEQTLYTLKNEGHEGTTCPV
jgi:hypothetical protein